jgi:hypothetical protein
MAVVVFTAICDTDKILELIDHINIPGVIHDEDNLLRYGKQYHRSSCLPQDDVYTEIHIRQPYFYAHQRYENVICRLLIREEPCSCCIRPLGDLARSSSNLKKDMTREHILESGTIRL